MQKTIQRRGCAVPFYKTGGFTAFILGFLSLLAVLLPIIVAEKGYFIYYGDFNAQQLPFNYLASEAVKAGDFGWNWNTDLGANFIGSYAFYLFGSPFFWLTAVLPSSWVPHALPFVLALKHGIAALTAYAYIKRFVKSREAAVIGGLLYAFSGFQLFNIFFNHFQDVTAFFPLMLIAMEELVCNNRKGIFALTTALMAAINYFFFTGEAVFLVLYFIVRCFSKDFPATVKKFFLVLLEAVTGVMLACVILLPAALAILSNYRINERLYGLDMVMYSDKARILRIIQSFFMIPDVPARPNLFAESMGKWASIGGYLPLFSMTGVIAFLKHRDGHWAKRLVIICMICAFIPVLNSGFYMFNSSYYARWFFMPILIMAMMTAVVIDTECENTIPMKEGLWITGVITAAFGIISILPVKEEDGGISFFTLPKYPVHFCIVFGIAVISIASAAFIAKKRHTDKSILKKALVLTVTACVVCTTSVVYFGAFNRDDALEYIDKAIDNENDISVSVSEDNFFRCDISEGCDNYPMFWGIPSMRCFHSVVPGSLMEFYAEAGIGRDVASRPDTSHYALRGLFSVKYYFDEIKEEEEDVSSPLPGFVPGDSANGFRVYENEHFIPMGFTFDNYISRSEWTAIGKEKRTSVLIRAIVLEDEDAEKYGSMLDKLPLSERMVSEEEYIVECDRRKSSASSSFTYDSYGFTADITADKDNLAFFSVPYDEGFTAEVNGSETEIVKADAGFMAVPIQKGENHIVFRYETPGLKAGAVISVAGAVIFIAYIAINRKKNRR
ncbi:MAG: YfhO family protein [Ruminococcus sp.]